MSIDDRTSSWISCFIDFQPVSLLCLLNATENVADKNYGCIQLWENPQWSISAFMNLTGLKEPVLLSNHDTAEKDAVTLIICHPSESEKRRSSFERNSRFTSPPLHPVSAVSHLLTLSAHCHPNGVRESRSERPKTWRETPASPHGVLTATRTMPGMYINVHIFQ